MSEERLAELVRLVHHCYVLDMCRGCPAWDMDEARCTNADDRNQDELVPALRAERTYATQRDSEIARLRAALRELWELLPDDAGPISLRTVQAATALFEKGDK